MQDSISPDWPFNDDDALARLSADFQSHLNAARRLVLAQLVDDPAITDAVFESCDDMAPVAAVLAAMMASAQVRGHGGDRQAAAERLAATIGQPLELSPRQVARMVQREAFIRATMTGPTSD